MGLVEGPSLPVGEEVDPIDREAELLAVASQQRLEAGDGGAGPMAWIDSALAAPEPAAGARRSRIRSGPSRGRAGSGAAPAVGEQAEGELAEIEGEQGVHRLGELPGPLEALFQLGGELALTGGRGRRRRRRAHVAARAADRHLGEGVRRRVSWRPGRALRGARGEGLDDLCQTFSRSKVSQPGVTRRGAGRSGR